MNPLRRFQAWASQWPDAAPWAVVLWTVVLLAGGALSWSLWKKSRAPRAPATVTAPTLAVSSSASATAAANADVFEPARRALERYPASPDIHLAAGRLLLAAGQPGARPLLRAAVAALPSDDDALLALVEACWTEQARAEARQWHARLGAAAKRGLLATALGVWAGTEPDKKSTLSAELLRSAVTLLEAPDDSLRSEGARARLRHAASRPGPDQPDALRLLALVGRLPAEVDAPLATLAENSPHFADTLAAASRALASPSPELKPALARLPPAEPADASAYVAWLAAQGRERDGLDFLSRTATEAPARRVELLLAAGDLDGAQTLLATGAWGALPPEAVEVAFTAHRATTRNHAALAEELWALARRAAARDRAALAPLLRLALALDDTAGARQLFAASLESAPRDAALLRARALWAVRKENYARRTEALAAWRAVEPDFARLWLAERSEP